MRSLLTLLLGILFVACFVAFFLTDSALRYSKDGDAVVATAKRADVHGAVVDVATEFIASELGKQPDIQTVSRPDLRKLVAEVVSEEWTEETLRLVHGALFSALERSDKTAIVDLTETKVQLRRALKRLEQNAMARCLGIFGKVICQDKTNARQIFRQFGVRATRLLDSGPTEINLLSGARHGNRRAQRILKTMHDKHGTLKTIRWGALLVLAIALLLIALFNFDPTPLIAIGVCLAMGCGVYMGVRTLVTGKARTQVESALSQLDARRKTSPIEKEINKGTRRFAIALIDDSSQKANVPVILCGVVGILLIVTGGMTNSRRRRVPTRRTIDD